MDNEQKEQRKTYVKDNLGIYKCSLDFVCLLYRPSGILDYLYGCMVCKKLLEAERLSRSWLDQGRMGGGGWLRRKSNYLNR